MIRRLAFAAFVLAFAAALWFRIDRPVRVVPNFAAEMLCIETFLSGRDPSLAFEQIVAKQPGMNPVAGAIAWRVDREKREAHAALARLLSARAVFIEGYGCLLDHGAPLPPPRAASPPLAPEGPALVAPPAGSKLALALDHVFAPFEDGAPRGTQAVVVLKDGALVAERYADDVTPQTRVSGISLTKSLTNALVGVLVRDGALDVKAPGLIAAWSRPEDPRRAITVENLLRMDSGLDFDETNSGFDANTRMLYLEDDMAAFSEGARRIAAPGERWAYSSSSIMVVDALLRAQIGGPDKLAAFARERLFVPAGMTSFALGFDATGTFVGSTHAAATARDWARFGELFRNDGMAGQTRILPQGWADFSASPTSSARYGYGVGFWTNRGDSFGALARVKMGFPADSWFASGSMGQRVVIVPSQKLTIVRLGRVARWPDFDIEGTARLVRETVEALNAP